VTQEVYALLITYQGLRTALADATLTRPDIRPDPLSFTIALNTARNQAFHPAAAITATTATCPVPPIRLRHNSPRGLKITGGYQQPPGN